ncbi:MAG: uroporphyrinogen decarboxylase family protein [Anaerolineae bacterium]|jgi:uroporphyrinogen decarboxylase|nr:uroporphyrinogen decarboxylase family protein [Anaerolineae bacterium]
MFTNHGFQPDYTHMLSVLKNQRPARLPVYEHIVNIGSMEKVLNHQFAELSQGDESDREEFMRQYCRFWQEMTYDTVSFEVCITEILPDNGAIMGGKKGPIQTRTDFERYPWDELQDRYWAKAKPQFDLLRKCLPAGMKALGGVGNGAFEISEDLVGYQYLAYMQADDPELFADVYNKIGDLMAAIWQRFLAEYTDVFCICRMGDDLGFKTGTLVSPRTLRQHVLPQYKKVLDQVNAAGMPFLYHSCGKIFSVMDDIIDLGIHAKHSNEDIIAPFDEWIERYSGRIGLCGGIDVDLLCQKTPAEITADVVEKGTRFRAAANGYALGSGNSIPEYVPTDGYLAMIEGAQKIRENETN